MASSSVALSEATSTSVPRKVTDVKLVWDDGIISIKIPTACRLGSVEEDKSQIYFAQFARLATGGLINFHVHGKNPMSNCGKSIRAYAKVYRKEMEGGDAYLYVDLHPTDKEPTHRLAVFTPSQPFTKTDKTKVLELPLPMRGNMVIVPADVKF